MTDLTELQKLEEEYPDFFKTTPLEIVDFALSEKTSEKIADIAIKNGVVDEEKIEGIAQRITLVLLNKLPSENLAMTLELGVKLTPEIAKKIADEINQFIDNAGIKQKPKVKTIQPIIEESPKRPPSKDTYREKIE